MINDATQRITGIGGRTRAQIDMRSGTGTRSQTAFLGVIQGGTVFVPVKKSGDPAEWEEITGDRSTAIYLLVDMKNVEVEWSATSAPDADWWVDSIPIQFCVGFLTYPLLPHHAPEP